MGVNGSIAAATQKRTLRDSNPQPFALEANALPLRQGFPYEFHGILPEVAYQGSVQTAVLPH